MQAMTCGLAVVSTPVWAICEAVVDGVTGILVEPRNTDAVAWKTWRGRVTIILR